MKSITILSQMHPETAAALEASSLSTIRTVLRSILLKADTALLSDPVINKYVEACKSGVNVDAGMARELHAALEELDSQYFHLEQVENAPEEQWGLKFNQARLAAALAMMASGITKSNYADIIYELAYAYGEPVKTLRLIGRELSNSS